MTKIEELAVVLKPKQIANMKKDGFECVEDVLLLLQPENKKKLAKYNLSVAQNVKLMTFYNYLQDTPDEKIVEDFFGRADKSPAVASSVAISPVVASSVAISPVVAPSASVSPAVASPAASPTGYPFGRAAGYITLVSSAPSSAESSASPAPLLDPLLVCPPWEEEDMRIAGEKVTQDDLEKVLAIRNKEERVKKLLSLVSVPSICVAAGLGFSEDAAAALLPTVARSFPKIAAKLTTIVCRSFGVLWVGAGVVMLVQSVALTFRYLRGQITWQQLVKYVAINAASNVAAVGGAVGGGAVGVVIGTAICPGIGSLIGGIFGALIGGAIAGGVIQAFGSWLGNKVVNDEEHFKKAELRQQYKNALKIFQMKKNEVSRESVEHKKRVLFKLCHPDKVFTEKEKKENEAKFRDLCAAYYVIMYENNYLDTPSAPDHPLLLQ